MDVIYNLRTDFDGFCDAMERNFQDQEMHSSTTTNLFHLSLQFVATRETRIKTIAGFQ